MDIDFVVRSIDDSIDAATGYRCAMILSPLGTPNGYVCIHRPHPYWGLGYDDVPDISVHGGLTFADYRVYVSEMEPREGEWWLGFDVLHAGDAWSISDSGRTVSMPGEVRDEAYVRKECESLAAQLAEVAGVRS